MRLNSDLVEEAEKEGKRSYRVPGKQIEYWAEIGRACELHMSIDQINRLRDGQLFNDLPATQKEVTFKETLDLLKTKRTNQELKSDSLTDESWFRISKTHAGYLEKVNQAGTVIIGKIKNGKFVKVDKDVG